MPCNIYLDTSILCALADPPARSAYARTCQTLTRRWFRTLPNTLNLCTSTFALDKIKAGPAALASARLRAAEPLHVLTTENIFTSELELFLAGGGLRSNTSKIGSEIACAGLFGIDLYATWDWQQLEASRLAYLRIVPEQAGLSALNFVSPLQLLETDYEALQITGGR